MNQPASATTSVSPSGQPVCVSVQAGVCGFQCRITAQAVEKRTVAIAISHSECNQIKKLGQKITTLGLKDLFLPATRNPVFLAAQQSACHPSCIVPVAVLKAAEVAMEMALPRPAALEFNDCIEG